MSAAALKLSNTEDIPAVDAEDEGNALDDLDNCDADGVGVMDECRIDADAANALDWVADVDDESSCSPVSFLGFLDSLSVWLCGLLCVCSAIALVL